MSEMNVRSVSRQPILQPCSLEGYAWQVDPYIGCQHLCAYCYALSQAETDWGREILTYQDLVTRLGLELDGLHPQAIYMGWNTDPYQPAEEIHQQTRRVLELLASRGHWPCILTKSGLVTRDVDLLAAMPGANVGISLAFHDEQVRRLFEANAPPNRQRIEALKTVKQAGIRTYALVCPVMPYITNMEALIDIVAPVADTIWIYPLAMKSENDRNWKNLMSLLSKNFPNLVELYRQAAFEKDHPYWLDSSSRLEETLSKTELNWRNQLK